MVGVAWVMEALVGGAWGAAVMGARGRVAPVVAAVVVAGVGACSKLAE
jgi:hypothetical protein